MEYAIAQPSPLLYFFPIIATLLIILLVNLMLKKFTWRDFIPVGVFIALLLVLFLIPVFLVIPFLLILFLPDKKHKETRGKLELLNIFLFAFLAVFIFGSFYTVSDGAVNVEQGNLDVMVVIVTAVSSVSLLIKRTLRNYSLNALNAFIVLWVYLIWIIIAPPEFASDHPMSGVTGAGITPVGYFILLILVLRFFLTLFLAVKMLLKEPQGGHKLLSKPFFATLLMTLILVPTFVYLSLTRRLMEVFMTFFFFPQLVLTLLVAYFIVRFTKCNEKTIRRFMAALFLLYAFLPLGIYQFSGTNTGGIYANILFPYGWLAVLLAAILLLFGRINLEKIISFKTLLIVGGTAVLLLQIFLPLEEYLYDLSPMPEWHSVEIGAFGSPIFFATGLLLSALSIPLLSIFTAILLHLRENSSVEPK